MILLVLAILVVAFFLFMIINWLVTLRLPRCPKCMRRTCVSQVSDNYYRCVMCIHDWQEPKTNLMNNPGG